MGKRWSERRSSRTPPPFGVRKSRTPRPPRTCGSAHRPRTGSPSPSSSCQRRPADPDERIGTRHRPRSKAQIFSLSNLRYRYQLTRQAVMKRKGAELLAFFLGSNRSRSMDSTPGNISPDACLLSPGLSNCDYPNGKDINTIRVEVNQTDRDENTLVGFSIFPYLF